MAANHHDETKGSQDRGNERHDRTAQGPSLMKTLLLAGAVALVCGVVGAWGYSALFGPDKSKSGQGSDSGGGGSSGSSKDSGSGSGGGSGGSGGESGSSKDSSTGKETGSRKNSTSNDRNPGAGKMLEAQSAWLTAVKELREAKDSEKKSRDTEEEKKAVLDFLKRTLLSAGKPGGGSLSAAFWASGEGKDVSLRQALDATDSQVSGAFTDRPLAEATVRELLGVGYLNVGQPERSVQEYERAMSLREATQGPTSPEAAACRNQLAVAYRIAGKTVEAGRLFEQNPNSPTHAAALAARGATLLLEHRAADAEARLREALMIRRKAQPDDWMTFDTESMLGQALLDQKKYDEAEPYLNGGYEGLKQREKKIPATDRPRITRALERLVRLYESRGEDEKAKKWRQELQIAEATIKPDTPSTLP
ncbi:MAG: tetratricopeptide repeat protein [Isosphaeraceae bacterium]